MRFPTRLAAALLALSIPALPQSFEAASVKVVESGAFGLGALRGGPGTSAPGALTGVATLKLLLMRAYNLRDYQILGPGWLDSARFQIQAKLPPGASPADVAPMLQSLLADRFSLQAHRETRTLAAYALSVARGGPKLTPSDAAVPAAPTPEFAHPALVKGPDGLPDLAPGAQLARSYSVILGGSDGLLYKLWARRETMSQLADLLSARLNRPVVDATRLAGPYDFTLSWSVESAGGEIPRTGPPPDQIESTGVPVLSPGVLPLFGAVQTQLGLRLDSKRLPVEVLVIDRANPKPSGN